MALPTISHNTPTSGSISWTAFSIAFNGVTYGIPADTTNKKFVWWVYNGGAPYLAADDSFPTIAPEDLLLFLNKNGIGLLVPMADVTDGSLVVPGSIYATAIAADQIDTYHLKANVITSDKIMANAVGAEEIAAGAVLANHVAAGSITVDKLTSGSIGDNAVPNGSFEEFDASGAPIGWQTIAQTSGLVEVVSGPGVTSSGAYALRLTASTTTANIRVRQADAKFIPVSSASNRSWYISARMGTAAATTAGVWLRANWFDASKVLVSTSDAIANSAMTTTFTLYEGQVTPPATARYMGLEVIFMNPNVATSLYVDEITAREVIVAAQIGNGQITAAKIVAGTITGDRLAASTITGDKILVSDRTNFWENPDFEGDTVGGIPRGTTLTSTTNARIISGGSAGSGKALEINALNGSNNDVYGANIFPVEPGDQYYIQYDWKYLNTTGTGQGVVGFRTYNAAKAGVSWSGVSTGTTKLTTWQYDDPATATYNAKVGVFTVPTGVYFLQPWISFGNNGETTNRLHIDNLFIRRMNGGELLVDGAVTALKIAANAVTANHISANSVTANAIAANAVTANAILANAVTAAKIAANAVTANSIAANAVTANAIASNSVLAKHVLIGDFENLATINEVHGLTVSSYGQTQVVSGYNSLVTDSGQYFMFTDQRGPVPFKNGEELYYSFTAKATAATTAQFAVWIYNAASSNLNAVTPTFNIGTTDTPISGSIVVPTATQAFGPAKQFVIGLTGVSNKGIQVKDVVVRRRGGGELLVDGAITAVKIGANAVTANAIAANAVTAIQIAANAVTANQIAANAITSNKLESNLILSTRIIAGQQDGTYAEMSPSGFRVFADSPVAGDPSSEVVRLGVASTDDYFAVTRADGTLAATISQDGKIVSDQVNATSSLYYKGTELSQVLAGVAGGIRGWAQRTSYSAQNADNSTRMPYLRLNVPVKAGRFYKVTTSPIASEASDSSTSALIYLNFNYSGNAGTFDPFLTNALTSKTSVNSTLQTPISLSGITASSVDGYLSVLITFQASGPGVVGMRGSTSQPVWMVVEDMGPQMYQAGIDLDGTAPPPTATPTNYYKEYSLTGASSYNGANNYYAYMENKMFQGESPAGIGNTKSIATFQSMTADLSGATITDMRVYLYFDSWYYNAGGTARIGLHGFSTPPATFSHSVSDAMISSGWPKPGGRWVGIPSTYWAGFKSGTYKGISLSAPGGDYQYYGIAAENALISVSYTK